MSPCSLALVFKGSEEIKESREMRDGGEGEGGLIVKVTGVKAC